MTHTEARFILGLPPTFSPDDLKRAHRKAAVDNHPDRGGNAERMVLINEAFELLSGQAASAASAAAASPEPSADTWRPHQWSEADAEEFRRETGHDPSFSSTHPLDKYVRGISAALAIVLAIIFALERHGWTDILLMLIVGAFVYYWMFSLFVRFALRCGTYAYNATSSLYSTARTDVAPEPMAWITVIALIAIGLIAFVIGDGGPDYNGYFVFLGWVCIATAIVGRRWPVVNRMVLHVVVGSFNARPYTWILIGAAAAMIVWLLDRDPSLGPVLGAVGFLGGLLLVFILRYVRARPSQSLRTRIWNRLIGLGLLAMLFVAAIALALSLPALAIAVSWIYWFGWTWVSWLIAGRLALQRSNGVSS